MQPVAPAAAAAPPDAAHGPNSLRIAAPARRPPSASVLGPHPSAECHQFGSRPSSAARCMPEANHFGSRPSLAARCTSGLLRPQSAPSLGMSQHHNRAIAPSASDGGARLKVPAHRPHQRLCSRMPSAACRNSRRRTQRARQQSLPIVRSPRRRVSRTCSCTVGRLCKNCAW